MRPELIYVVAVDFDPIQWAVHCEICDDIVSEPAHDGHAVDLYEIKHRKKHVYWGRRQVSAKK